MIGDLFVDVKTTLIEERQLKTFTSTSRTTETVGAIFPLVKLEFQYMRLDYKNCVYSI